MTLKEAINSWCGGNAVLRHNTGKVVLIYKNGNLDFGEGYISPEILFGYGWALEYPLDFDLEKLLRALTSLDSNCGQLLGSEGGDWSKNYAEKVVFAVARAMGFSIKSIERTP
jgi:hypothetical protein